MKMFCLVKMKGGEPDVNSAVTPYYGYVHAADVAGWGAYLFSGTTAQLTAINALPNVYGICAVTESGNVKWAELDGVISSAVRTKINNWLTARGYPTIPAGWTYRQVVNAIFKRLNDRFDLTAFDVMDGG